MSDLPDKAFFKIGEVARLCSVKPSVLRFWETEFKSLKPEKSQSKQRVYSRSDVELLLRIRHLLYEERLTIEGARKQLRRAGRDEAPAERPPPQIDLGTLRKIRQDVLDLLRIVGD